MSYSTLGLDRTSLDQIYDLTDMPRAILGDPWRDHQDWQLVIDPSLSHSNSALTISHVQLSPLERYDMAYSFS